MTTGRVRTDDEIRRDVLAELTWDRRVRGHHVDVSVENGVATLTGWVDYCAGASHAERAAQRVLGVREVANSIEVRMGDSDVRDDADLAADVTRAIYEHVEIRDEPPQVTVADGWVTLRGEVEWNHKRRVVDNVVKQVCGVRGVTNLLTVRPWQKPSAEGLKRKIEEALRRNCETDAGSIAVEVHGDAVTLTGTVRSWCEKDAADKVVWFAPGIRSVDNRIQIDHGHRPSYTGTGAPDTF